jgi:hypothetical protein
MVEKVSPEIERLDSGRELVAAVDLGLLQDLPKNLAWRVGVSAVVENADSSLSYWALRHPPGKPDFHHPDCFALELPPPSDS